MKLIGLSALSALLLSLLTAHGQTTTDEWKQEAVRQYPALGVAGSPLNKRFADEYQILQKQMPGYFLIKDWPVQLAKKCSEGLNPPAPEQDKEFADAVARSEERAIALYPDCGNKGTPLWNAITAEIDRLDGEKSPVMNDPDYPVMLAAKCAAKLGIAPGSTPAAPAVIQTSTPAQPAHPALVQVADVKKFWLENQPPDGGTLAASYHAIRKQNDLERQQIESGLFDDDAQDEANRSNIERLRAAGFVQDAAALQTERNSYRARVAATNAQSAANRVPGPTQRDGRPLPRNWIDPNQADANFHAEQIEREARRLRQQIEELNNRLRR